MQCYFHLQSTTYKLYINPTAKNSQNSTLLSQLRIALELRAGGSGPLAGDNVEAAGADAGLALQRDAAVSIRQLCKAYGHTQALRSVSLDMHAGQICALLGHNGAGKSTLVAILTGALHLGACDRTSVIAKWPQRQWTLADAAQDDHQGICSAAASGPPQVHAQAARLAASACYNLPQNGRNQRPLAPPCTGMLEPSGGDAMLAGHSVVTEAGAVQRAKVGLCPQRNVLFGALTVAEHLTLYAAIRGMPGGCFRVLLLSAGYL